MAKTTRTGKNKTAPAQSKSASIREYLAKNPDANPKRIVEDLKAKGIDLSLGLACDDAILVRRPLTRTGNHGRICSGLRSVSFRPVAERGRGGQHTNTKRSS